MDISNVTFGTGNTAQSIELDGMNYGVSGATVKQAKLQNPITVGTTTVSSVAYAEITDAAGTTTTVILYPSSDMTAQAGNTLTLGNGKTIDLTSNNVTTLFDSNGKVVAGNEDLFTTLYGSKDRETR